MKRFGWVIALLIALSMASWAMAQETQISIKEGWNLLSSPYSFQVSDKFGDPQKFTSVWKWTFEASPGGQWAVYLPGKGDGGADYASSKNFILLKEIAPGEGFWVKSTVANSISFSGTAPSNTDLTLKPGWNLLGLKTQSPVSVEQKFGDASKFASIWKWDTSVPQGKWAVYLPGKDTATYANSKNFSVLNTIEPNEGFWVNLISKENVQVSFVETPPLVGKVVEAGSKGEKISYIPLAGVKVSVDNKDAGITDSQGKFQYYGSYGSEVTVTAYLKGYFLYENKVDTSKEIYIFLQKQDPNKTELQSTEQSEQSQLSKGVLFPQKPTPKIIKSSDEKASMSVLNMKLLKDTTVSLTPFAEAKTIPGIENISQLNLGNDITIIAGAKVDMADSLGNPTNNDKAGFEGMVSVRINKILGKYSLDQVDTLVQNKQADLKLIAKEESGWYLVGDGEIKTEDNVKWLVNKTGFNMLKLHTFVFALIPMTQGKKGTISGKVIDSKTKNPIPGVYVGTDSVYGEAITDKEGKYSISISSTDIEFLESNKISIIGVYAWEESHFFYYKSVNLSDVKAGKNLDIALEPFEEVLRVKGIVTDSSNGKPISDAFVQLKAETITQAVENIENGICVGKANVNYVWTIYDLNYNVKKNLSKPGKNCIFSDDVKDIIKTDEILLTELTVANPAGYTEKAFGYVMDFENAISFDLYPDLNSIPYFACWTLADGSYEFYGVQKIFFPVLKISAYADGYKKIPFSPLKQPDSNNLITQDIALEPKPPAQAYTEDFENTLNWQNELYVNGEKFQSSSLGWHQVNPESVVIKNQKMKDALKTLTYEWIDLEGTLGEIYLLECDNDWCTYTSTVYFESNGKQLTVDVEMWDLDKSANNGYEVLYSSSEYYDVWYDYSKYPSSNGFSMDLKKGSKVMVSYMKSKDITPTLPPSASGNKNIWFGYLASSDNELNGTYYDSGLQENKKVEGYLISPLIDLTNFSQARLTLDTWFEVDMGNYAFMYIDVALADEEFSTLDELELVSIYGTFKMKKGSFKPLEQFNPMTSPISYNQPIPFGSYLEEMGIPTWFKQEINLDPFAGHKIKLRFRFITLNKPNNIFRGWAVDNIKIEEKQSFVSFKLLTEEFGYYYNPESALAEEGKNISGTYSLSYQVYYATYYDFLNDPLNPNTWKSIDLDTEQVNLVHSGLNVQFEFHSLGSNIVFDGTFDDQSYSSLSFGIYDKETYGFDFAGSGTMDVLTDGSLSGSFTGFDKVNSLVYSGKIKLVPVK